MLFNFEKYFVGKTASHTFSDNDACRIAAYFTQNGLCYVSGRPLLKEGRELHHRLPRMYGGKDEPEKLVLLETRVHRMVHTDSFNELYALLLQIPMSADQLRLLNQLRVEARNQPYEATTEEKT